MKTHMKMQVLALGAVAIVLLLGCGLKAHATLRLKISDNLGNSVTVTDNDPNDSNPTTGAILFVGPVGTNWVSASGGVLTPDVTTPNTGPEGKLPAVT